jgi:hypothetical protein
MGNLTEHDKSVFSRSGFITEEIEGYDSAVMDNGAPVSIDLNNVTWKRVLRDRERFRHNYMKGGASQQQFIGTIKKHREKRKAEGEKNPEWEFLRADYGRYITPSGKQPIPSDIRAAKAITKIGGKRYWKDY